MGGGLLQIVSYGTQDLTLTGNPEITFFNIIYRRYTNFGAKKVLLSFDNTPEFNSTAFVNIPKNSGDLISNIILQIKLPKINFQNLNKMLVNEYKTPFTTIDSYFSYYRFYLNFYNRLKNTVNTYFATYDTLIGSLSYITELESYILKYFNLDQYQQFFLSIKFYFNIDIENENSLISNSIVNYNIDNFTNASLFKIENNNFVYIYKNLSYTEVSYEEFKFTIYKNMEILENLNLIIYQKLLNVLTIENKINVCWVNKIGLYLFNSIEFYIGSNKINTLSDIYMNNYGNLYYKNQDLYNKLIGNNQLYNSFSDTIDSTILYVPVPFWFINNYGLSFPLIALQYNSIQVRLNTKKFTECIKINIDSSIDNTRLQNEILDYITNNQYEIISSKLEINMIVEYVYLDSIERKKFAQSSHEYLIEQVQEIEFDDLSTVNNFFTLDFYHCVKDIFWNAYIINTTRSIFNNIVDGFNNTFSTKKLMLTNIQQRFYDYISIISSPYKLFNIIDYLNGLNIIKNTKDYLNKFQFVIDYYYSNIINPYVFRNQIISESYMYLNSVQLIGENSNYFNYVHPYNYYNQSPQIGTNVYSFCLKPTEFQPSGSVNLSRITSFTLRVKLNDINNTLDAYNQNLMNTNFTEDKIKYRIVFQVRNFNVLRLIGGIGATAYTY
jgi:hypothetical protein